MFRKRGWRPARASSNRLAVLLTAGAVVGCVLGYSIAASLQQLELRSTSDLYAIAFNPDGLAAFPNPPTTSLPPGMSSHVEAPLLDNAGTATGGTSDPTTIAATFTASQTGDLLVAAVATDGESHAPLAPSDLSDSFGSSWALEGSPLEFLPSGGASPGYLYLFYALAGGHAGTETVTVSFASDAVHTASLLAFGISGVDPSGPWDPAGAQEAVGSGNAAARTIVTTAPCDLVLDLAAATTGAGIVPSPGFAPLAKQNATGGDFAGYAEYDRTPGAGAYTASPSWGGGTARWGLIVVGVEGVPTFGPAPPVLETSASSESGPLDPASLEVNLTTGAPQDLLVLAVITAAESAPTLSAANVSDAFGLTWAEEGSPFLFLASTGPSPAYEYLFFAETGALVGHDLLSVSFATDPVETATLVALAFHGVNPADPWDPGGPGTAAGSGTSASPSITTSYGAETLLSLVAVQNVSPITGPHGWTEAASGTAEGGLFSSYVGYEPVTSTGPYAASTNWTGTQSYGGLVAALEGESGFEVPSSLSPQPCQTAFSLPGGSGAQTPDPVFVNATGNGTTCGLAGQNYMFVEWQLVTNQSAPFVAAGTYYFNFTFSWVPLGASHSATFETSVVLTVGGSGQTNGPTLVLYLVFGVLPSAPVPGSVIPNIEFIGCSVAP